MCNINLHAVRLNLKNRVYYILIIKKLDSVYAL